VQAFNFRETSCATSAELPQRSCGRLHPEYQSLVIFIEFGQHVGRRDILSIVVSNSRQAVDVANRANSRATDLSHMFCNIVRNRQDLVSVLVEQQLMIAEVRGRSCAMKFFVFRQRANTSHLPKRAFRALEDPSPLQERCPMEFLVVLALASIVQSRHGRPISLPLQGLPLGACHYR